MCWGDRMQVKELRAEVETLTRQLAEAREALNLAAGYMRDRADPLPEHMAKVDAALAADRPAREEE